MEDKITYWKCPHCYGTGKVVRGQNGHARIEACAACDGSGAEERHKRAIAEIEARERG